MELSNTYAVIDLEAIRENYQNICKKAGKPVMAVIKADAYGHGAVAVAKALEETCIYFGVSSVAEGVELRKAGIKRDILILGHTHPDNYKTAVKNQLQLAIFSYEDAEKLMWIAGKTGTPAYVHFAVDTGMSRIGFQVTEESADLCKKISELPYVVVTGIFSHFATADERDLRKTHEQAERFARFWEMLEARGMKKLIRHLDNSAGIMNFGAHWDMVRAGIILYGLYPSDEVEKHLLSIRPAMSWYSRVSHVKTLPAGRELSYGGTYTTKGDTVVATVAAGYADGYRRNLSGAFYVLIRGKKAPILGRVCMDQFMVDVTEIPGVVPGDRVTLMGVDGEEEISAETIAAAAGSFNYEQVCDLSRRVERVYMQGGKEVLRKNYLVE